MALRELCHEGGEAPRVVRDALQVGALLDRAEESLAGGGGARVAFWGALIVILREGVEAALLVLLLLGVARRSAQAGSDAPTSAVHVGWVFAVLAGVVTWFASAPLLRLGGARREVMEGVIALVAAAVLLYAGHFVLARLDAQRRVEALRARLAAPTTTRRRPWLLCGLGFLAVYREALEVVLFLRAIALGAPLGVVLAGAAAGGLLLVLFVALLGRVGRRLQPGPLLGASGTLLCALAVVLAGKGVRALQEAGVLGIRPLTVPRVEWLGLFPSLEGVLAQLLVLLAFLAVAAVALRRARGTALPT
jgi:high-affinity iron transporter